MGPGQSEPTAMLAELQRMIVLPIAFVLFVCAAQAAAGLNWRGAPSETVIASR
jgi:hypothetical protein